MTLMFLAGTDAEKALAKQLAAIEENKEKRAQFEAKQVIISEFDICIY